MKKMKHATKMRAVKGWTLVYTSDQQMHASNPVFTTRKEARDALCAHCQNYGDTRTRIARVEIHEVSARKAK